MSPSVHRSGLGALLHLDAMHAIVVALALSMPARAMANELDNHQPYPAQITKPAELDDIPGRLLVDDHVGITSVVNWALPWNGDKELRMRHKRKDDEETSEDETTDDDRSTKTKDGVSGTKTKDEDAETNTSSSGDDEEDEDDQRPTKTISENLDDLSTLTVSLAPSSTPTEDSDAPLPSAFDGAVTSDFKSADGDESCPDFINSLLSSPTFKECYPLSMMLQTSTGFFQARKKLTSTVRVLDTSCAADISTCTDFMSAAAKNLTSEENCEEEYENGLSVVMQAYRGLRSYGLMYSATCLQDPDSENYCYANAVTNLTTPSDGYLYFLPYDLDMPGSATPSCNSCNRETMSIFHAAGADRSQFIADTYEEAARLVNNICGSDFVNDTLPDPETSMSLSLGMPALPALTSAFTLAVTLGFML